MKYTYLTKHLLLVAAATSLGDKEQNLLRAKLSSSLLPCPCAQSALLTDAVNPVQSSLVRLTQGLSAPPGSICSKESFL